MEILNYTEKHQVFRQELRRFLADEFTPHVDEWEKAGIVPRNAWQKMGERGFLCTSVPSEYGGMGGDFLYSVIVAEEMARTRHTGLLAPLHSDIIVPYITSYASEELKHQILPDCVRGKTITALAMTETETGSDLASIQTTAVEEGDQVLINGQKTFISNGIHADLVILAAKDPLVANPHEALNLYLIKTGTPGFERGTKFIKLGLCSQDTAELFFNDCRIARNYQLGAKGQGFNMLMEKLQQERLVVSLLALTLAETIMTITLDHCRNHSDFGRPITTLERNRLEIVEIATEIKLGRIFLETLINDHMAGKSGPRDVSMAKYWITDMAQRVADRCIRLFGGCGLLEGYPIARLWRDVRVLSIFAGTNEVMKGIVAKQMGL